MSRCQRTLVLRRLVNAFGPVAAATSFVAMGGALAWLHEHGEVVSPEDAGDGAESEADGGEGRLTVAVRLSNAAHARFRAR